MKNAAAARGLPGRPAAGAPMGIAGTTRVLTLDGAIPAEFLSPGDRIVTRDAGALLLLGLRVICHDALCTITLRASALGHGRPAAELTLAPHQLVLIRDWRAPALYGVARALVPALRLADGVHVTADAPRARRIYELIFGARRAIYAEGAELAMPLTAGGLVGDAQPG